MSAVQAIPRGFFEQNQKCLLAPCLAQILAGTYATVRLLEYVNLEDEAFLQLGDKGFPNSLNKQILELMINFIHETGQFECNFVVIYHPIPS